MPVDRDRLRDLTLELVEVESPTGDTADVSRLYAHRLEELGMEVELLADVFPATPTVVARLRGGEPGPTIVLNGHLDTVPIPHEPAGVENGSVYGRGSADMKGALACAAAPPRILEASGPFPGELVIIAIGMHEAPGGRGEDLTYLLGEYGFTADLGVVCELGGPTLPVAHPGCATFAITIGVAGKTSSSTSTSIPISSSRCANRRATSAVSPVGLSIETSSRVRSRRRSASTWSIIGAPRLGIVGCGRL